MASRHRSSAAPLAWVYVGLIFYASLYPLGGWHWPSGIDIQRVLRLPWPQWFIPFDIVSNLLGYLPLGALLYLALVRGGTRFGWALLWAVLLPAALSYAMEVIQSFLPSRVPSLLDWLLNASGAFAGVLIAALLHWRGVLSHWQSLRERWFVERNSAGPLALLLLWPAGLLFPTALPFGLGQVMDRLREWARAAAEGTPWETWIDEWVTSAVFFSNTPSLPVIEGPVVVMGLLAPCLLAFSVIRSQSGRLGTVMMITAVGLVTTTLSTALNFGPQHALAWVSTSTPSAIASAVGLASVLAFVPQRVAVGLGLICTTLLISLVAQAPSDPYYASSLSAWEQGRFIRFHGLTRWISGLWPYAALVALMMRMNARDTTEPQHAVAPPQ